MGLNLGTPTWRRPTFKQCSAAQTMSDYSKCGVIGADTSPALHPFLVNLASFFLDGQSLLTPLPILTIGGMTVVADGGIRRASFGKRSGGTWQGNYRYFVVKDLKGNDHVVSIAVLGTQQTHNHPKYGNRRGTTTLVAAVDNFEKSHNALQLCLDDFVETGKNKYTIWHNGRMSGKTRAAVLNFVQQGTPGLVKADNRGRWVEIGTFNASMLVSWQQRQTKAFVGNLITYALLRDEFR